VRKGKKKGWSTIPRHRSKEKRRKKKAYVVQRKCNSLQSGQEMGLGGEKP